MKQSSSEQNNKNYRDSTVKQCHDFISSVRLQSSIHLCIEKHVEIVSTIELYLGVCVNNFHYAISATKYKQRCVYNGCESFVFHRNTTDLRSQLDRCLLY